MNAEEKSEQLENSATASATTTTTTTTSRELEVGTAESADGKIEKSKSAEEVASMISQQQQSLFAKSNENLMVSNFVSFFEPLINNLDTNVQSLR